MDPTSMIEAAPAAIIATSDDGKVRFANPAAETLFGPHVLRANAGSLLRWADDDEVSAGAWRRGLAIHHEQGPLPVEIVTFTYDEGGDKRTAHVARETGRQAGVGPERLVKLAAHDLREPLRMVGAYTALLQGRYADKLDADAAQFLAFAADGARRMEAVVEGLVLLARLRSEPPLFEPCDTGACASGALAALSREIEARRAEVRVVDLPTVLGDQRRLTQLFRNLLDNALKFSEAAPRVVVSASSEGDGWRFAVADNGIGVDERFRGRVFEPFERLHPVGAYPGAGVGLAICREIVASHGGRIRLEPADGGGSRFEFTIPRLAASTDATGGEGVQA